MLKFSAKDLKLVLQEARKNHCGVVLAKDNGVYIMSEIGEMTSRGRKVAYVRGVILIRMRPGGRPPGQKWVVMILVSQ
ncbi:hypothetical protein [Hafnia paralvei]|uniref:hypothetical protein n=1 Tax=Hafnia paralvei TaxID=546367 RepID=UPI0026ACA4D5